MHEVGREPRAPGPGVDPDPGGSLGLSQTRLQQVPRGDHRRHENHQKDPCPPAPGESRPEPPPDVGAPEQGAAEDEQRHAEDVQVL